MKKLHWLNLAEYASAVGLGVGAVASIALQKMLYVSAPLSFLVLLNLVNRRRFEEMSEKNSAIALSELHRKIAKHVELLNQQILALPTPETVGNVRKSLLRKDQENLERVALEIRKLRHEIQERLALVEQRNLDMAQEEIDKLKVQYHHLADALGDVTTHLHRLSDAIGVDGLENAVVHLRSDVGQLQISLQKLTEQTRPTLASLQEQISNLNRHFQKLPPPFDGIALKDEVNELIKVISDLVPRRDWSAIVSEVQALHRQQESQTHFEESLRQDLHTLQRKFQTAIAPNDWLDLQARVDQIQRNLDQLSPMLDISALSLRVETLMGQIDDAVPKRDWSKLQNHIKALQEQQQQQTAATDDLRQGIQTIQGQIQQLPTTPQFRTQIENILHIQLEQISQQLQQESSQQRHLSSAIAAHPSGGRNGSAIVPMRHDADRDAIELTPIHSELELQERVTTTLRKEFAKLSEQLQIFSSLSDGELKELPLYEFMVELDTVQSHGEQRIDAIAGSRAILEAALQQTQERLILIWPWSRQCRLDTELMQQFELLLRRNCQLDVGWCHLVNRHQERFLSSINQRWAINPLEQGALQNTLHSLLQLKRLYPERFRFRILGTIENFLVCDDAFAVLGIDQVFATHSVFPDLELKLRTTDLDIIQRLTDRYETPDLDPQDLTAYWNRATTRHDLGDKPGSLADFDHILSITPDDAAAYNYRGTVRYDLGDSHGALADFNQAIHLNPQQIDAYCNRGFLRAETKNLQSAIADYSLAIWTKSDFAIAYFYRGLAYQKLGNHQGALADYTEALRFAPESAETHYHRGIVLQKMGDRQRAKPDFAKAAQLFNERGNPTNAQKALNNLHRLEQAARTAS